MKKFSYILLALALITPAISYATSGACSYHGGVNCSVYDSATGNAICNDGTESSVQYSAMVECQQTATYSCTSLLPNCDPSSYDSLISEAGGNASGACVAAGGAGTVGCGESVADAEAPYIEEKARCQAQIDLYQNCLNEQQTLSQQLQQQQQQTAQTEALTSCQSTYGPHSTYDQTKNQCACASGYWYDSANGQCEVPATVCMDTLGAYSHPTSDSCVCNDYYSAAGGGQCVSIKQDRQIDAAITNWLSDGGTCASNSSFTPDQKSQCVIYESNPDKYNWIVVNTSQSANAPPAQTQTPTNIGGLTDSAGKLRYTVQELIDKYKNYKKSILPLAASVRQPPPLTSSSTAATSARAIVASTIPTSSTPPAAPKRPEASFLETLRGWFARLNPLSWF